MPCHEPVKPITSKPPVCSLAMRNAASLDSLPVLTRIALSSPAGSSPARRLQSATTGSESMPLNRCSAPAMARRMAASTSGWLWPRVAHICPEVKSRIARPSRA